MTVDYSVYLVTDSTMIPEGCTFLGQVEQAVANGATLVQLREKLMLTRDFIAQAEKVHAVCKAKGVPLIINDRVDVALAIDAEGVHVGQDDMPAPLVRRLIGNDKILGVTCSTVEETEQVAKEAVADYVGLGTVYPTKTKSDVTDPQGTGPLGIRKMLKVLQEHNRDGAKPPIRSVAIGGINHSNAAQVMYQCRVGANTDNEEAIDGVAVVLCIMALKDAGKATRELQQLVTAPAPWLATASSEVETSNNYVGAVRDKSPLVHHLTNNVVKNFSANVTLAVGALPIMSELKGDFSDLAAAPYAACVVNMGTPDPDTLAMFAAAIGAYNNARKHVVFDPVGCGATSARLAAAAKIVNSGVVSVIKGNPGEVWALSTLGANYQALSKTVTSKGVDFDGAMSDDDRRELALTVAREFRCICVVTGAHTCIADADHAVIVDKGHPMMGQVTGLGCLLGSVIGAHLAVADLTAPSAFAAVVSAIERYGDAGTAAGAGAPGPGSFVPSFIDELARQK